MNKSNLQIIHRSNTILSNGSTANIKIYGTNKIDKTKKECRDIVDNIDFTILNKFAN